MADEIGPRAGSGQPRRRTEDLALSRRIGAWVVWWVLLMSFWVWIDDSLGLAELLAGAGAAAIGATVAELVLYQSDTHVRLRIEWVAPAVRLPPKLWRDTVLVTRVLWAKIVHGTDPPSRFGLIPVRHGEDSAEDDTRRLLVVGGMSFTPNTFVLGLDAERDVAVVHQLVARPESVGR
jgi:multisubunit Na+/H+ antiporter MnhE subunit